MAPTDVTVVLVDRHRFRAMGTGCEIVAVEAPVGALDRAERLVRDDEARWSRFLADSELSTLNRAAGRAVPVSAETVALVALAARAHQRTAGWFDPLLGHDVVRAGYDRPFDDRGPDRPDIGSAPTTPSAHPHLARRSTAGATLVAGAGRVTVPAGRALDLGGIAKGHTADRVLDLLLAAGVAGASVSIGGDIACAGTSPHDDGWWFTIDHAPDVTVGIGAGGIATSSTRHRRWTTPDGPAHHVIDPRTGQPATTVATDATVVAADGALAEVLATVALLAPPPTAETILTAHGAGALVSDGAGRRRLVGMIADHLAPPVGTPTASTPDPNGA